MAAESRAGFLTGVRLPAGTVALAMMLLAALWWLPPPA